MVAELAARQYGVVSRAQLLAIGLSHDAIVERMAKRRLHALHRGVYAVGHRAVSSEGRWLAAVLACGPEAVLSHQSTAALWDIRPTSRQTIDVTAPRARHRRKGIDVHLSRCLEPSHVTEHKGIRCTTVARTVVDLASVIDEAGITRAWRRVDMLGLLDVDEVRGVLGDGRGRRGAPILRSLIAEHVGYEGTKSELEDRFLKLCRSAGLPRPKVNTLVEANGATYEVDFLLGRQRLVVEADGWGPHRTRHAFESDRRRDADLLVAGLRVLRVTERQLRREADRVAATLRALRA